MVIYSPVISGSLTISGSILTTGGGLPLTGSLVSSGSLTSIGATVVSGSFTVITGSSIELQVLDTGVRIGNITSDNHNITGSVLISGSLNGSNATFRNDAASSVMNLQRIGTSGVRLQFENVGTDAFGIGMPATTADLAFFSSNTTERVRITSGGNVGIGKNSPNARLDVSGSVLISGSLTTTGTITATTLVVQTVTSSVSLITGSTQFGTLASNTHQFTGSLYITGSVGINAASSFRFNGVADTSHAVGYDSTVDGAFLRGQNGVRFLTGTGGGAERMRISAAGTASFTANTLASAGDAATITLKQNSTTAVSGIYLERSGEQKGYYIYVGGSVDSLTFQRNNAGTKADVMSLTRDGNVGIGTTTPLSLLDVCVLASGARRLLVNYDDSLVTIKSANSSATAENLRVWGDNIFFYTGSAGSGGELMRLTNTGRVGIGTTTPARKLDVFSDGVQFGDGGSFNFYMNSGPGAATGVTWTMDGTDRLRITPGGDINVLGGGSISTNGGAFRLRNSGQTASYGLFLTKAAWFGGGNTDYTPSIAAETGYGINTYTNGSTSPSGPYITAGGTSWTNGSSDVRKKKNFETTQGLEEILQIEPIKYHFNEDDDSSKKRLGFKAQNILPLIPEMVSETGEIAEDGSPYLTVTPDYILPVLVKAIQELKAENDTLKEILQRNNIQ